MSKRWRSAGLLLAIAAFSYTMLTGGRLVAGPDALPLVVSALLGAVVAFIWVWLIEGVVLIMRWLWRRLFPVSRPSDTDP